MFKRMMLMLVVICSMVLNLNAQEVTENLEKALNDPQAAAKNEKNAEIKEINAQDAAKEKEDKAQLTGDNASEIKEIVDKEVAEDEALGTAEDKDEANNEEEEADDDDNSSWFGWLWPFGGDDNDDDKVVTEDKTQAPTETVESAEVTTEEPVVETAKETVTEETPEIETVEETVTEETPEPAVEEDEDGGSWFGWLWPFGGDDEKTATEKTESEETAEEVTSEAPATETTAIEAVTETPDTETVTEEVAEGTEEPAVAEEQNTDTNEKINVADKLIYYFPNLFLNLLDSFSARIGVGAKSGVKLSLTRAFQLGGNYGDEYFLEKGIDRRYGGGYDNGYSFELGPLASEKRYIDDTIGTIPQRIIKQSKAKVQRPSNPIYKERYRNFWSVGIDAGWLVNIGMHLNPIELADFFTGIFFYDLCDDDLGRVADNQVEISQTKDEAETVTETLTDDTDTEGALSDDSDTESGDTDTDDTSLGDGIDAL